MKPYALVTAARNEAALIDKPIEAVMAQTVLPERWIVVDDGSTDGTADVVGRYLSRCPFLTLLRREGAERTFASKATAVRLAHETLAGTDYAYIGNLDADVSFAPDYYEQVLNRCERDERIGLAGGIRCDMIAGRFRKVQSGKGNVGGPFQFFRRRCFEDIGGYLPLRKGGIDAAAEVMARMKGWKVRSFPELIVYHHRCTGTATNGILRARFKDGGKNYLLGYHPAFELLKAVRAGFYPPWVIGGFLWLGGYVWAAIGNEAREVPAEVVAYLRKEQMARIRAFFKLPPSRRAAR